MKVQINLNDDIVKRVDEYAKTVGVTRSACCALWIGQALQNVEKQNKMIEKTSLSLVDLLASELEEARAKKEG